MCLLAINLTCSFQTYSLFTRKQYLHFPPLLGLTYLGTTRSSRSNADLLICSFVVFLIPILVSQLSFLSHLAQLQKRLMGQFSRHVLSALQLKFASLQASVVKTNTNQEIRSISLFIFLHLHQTSMNNFQFAQPMLRDLEPIPIPEQTPSACKAPAMRPQIVQVAWWLGRLAAHPGGAGEK